MNTTFQDKRQYPRVPVNLPLAFRMADVIRQGSGTVIKKKGNGVGLEFLPKPIMRSILMVDSEVPFI